MCQHECSNDDDGIIMARSAMADLRMTGDSPVTACMPEGRDCTWRRGVAKQDGRQGGLHEEAAHHRAGESNRTCAHPVRLLKQNPVQAHKRAQPRRGWRAVDRRAGGCAQNSGHVCSLVRHVIAVARNSGVPGTLWTNPAYSKAFSSSAFALCCQLFSWRSRTPEIRCFCGALSHTGLHAD